MFCFDFIRVKAVDAITDLWPSQRRRAQIWEVGFHQVDDLSDKFNSFGVGWQTSRQGSDFRLIYQKIRLLPRKEDLTLSMRRVQTEAGAVMRTSYSAGPHHNNIPQGEYPPSHM